MRLHQGLATAQEHILVQGRRWFQVEVFAYFTAILKTSTYTMSNNFVGMFAKALPSLHCLKPASAGPCLVALSG